MNFPWLSVLTEKRDAGLQWRAMNGRVGWCRMLWHNFLVWKLTSDPPLARRLTPGPKLMLSSLSLCARCHWLLSASVWTLMRGHDSGTETNCHWWATVDISDRFEPSHNRLWCPKPLFPLHFSFLPRLAVTVSHHSREWDSRLEHGRVNLHWKLFVPVQTLWVGFGIIIQLYPMLNSFKWILNIFNRSTKPLLDFLWFL